MPSSSSQSSSREQASKQKGSKSEQQAGGQKTAESQSQSGGEPALESADDASGAPESGDEMEPGDPTEEIALEDSEDAAAAGSQSSSDSLESATAEAESSLEELLEALESASNSGPEVDVDVDVLPPSGSAGQAQQQAMEEALEAMKQGGSSRPPSGEGDKAGSGTDSPPAGDGGMEGDGTDSSPGGAGIESVLARAEAGGGGIDAELAVLNQALEESLGQFDGEILGSRQSAQARDAQRGSTGTDIAMIDDEQGEGEPEGGSENGQGPGGLPGDMSSGTGSRPGLPQQARQGEYQHASSGATVPADIPDGTDDDVVARQIREAAMKEQDPELREKLWEEYRKYRASQ